MRRIQTIEELSFEAQASIIGGSFSGCTCATTCPACSACSCDVKQDQNKSSIDKAVKSNTNDLAKMLHNSLSQNN